MTAPRIEDHALLSDERTAALVTREGDVDWLCMPRFDSDAVLCSLLGEDSHGHWSLRIDGGEVLSRRYLPSTMVLETQWRSPTGTGTVTEFLPIDVDREGHAGDGSRSDLVRRVLCTEGEIEVVQELVLRFEYGAAVPWVRRSRDSSGQGVLLAVAGGDAVSLHGPALHAAGRTHRGRHRLGAGDGADWVLTWFPSWGEVPPAPDVDAELTATCTEWSSWLGQVRVAQEYAEPVARSLLVLRALTHRRSGGIIAAATTSLPEELGGVRNWDYRFCWLRDAALSLEALLEHGHVQAAVSWREWLLRAIAGDPERLQIMYSIAGDRNLPERVLDHLPGYEGSTPVRIGNAASDQYQADVVGEVMIALSRMREAGVAESHWSWPLQKALVRFTTAHVDEPDQGIWEMRGEPAFFTHGRVMMWATFDRAVRAVTEHGLPAGVDELAEWERLRDRVREEVLELGVGPDGSLTQTYGSAEVDASLLQIPHTGFLPADDPRMLTTVARIEQDLLTPEGLLLRYRTRGQDGLPGEEHPFLVCGFWLVRQYAASGRRAEAKELMERLLACGNDLHLFSEEYDGSADRMIGNFPQAFSHLGLVHAVDALAAAS